MLGTVTKVVNRVVSERRRVEVFEARLGSANLNWPVLCVWVAFVCFTAGSSPFVSPLAAQALAMEEVGTLADGVSDAGVGELALQDATLLDLYVKSPDPHYAYEVVETLPGDGYRTHVVRMASQAWLTKAEVDQPVWWHWMLIVEPDQVSTETALLFIGGGDNNDEQPGEANDLLASIATATHSVVAEVRMIPNQPLTFVGDTFGPRHEDQIIAFGWDKFLRGGARDHDALWLLRLPMTKAAVRAMDTVTSVVAERQIVDHFVVAGASKRGWTTWTTAAVDERVVAIVPMVIDMLNTRASFAHHWQAYGFWSPAVADYKREGVMEWQERPEYQRLLQITEPYNYRERLTLPKLLINASGDEFFLPDSWQFYWDNLEGEKHLRYVPNTGHSLAGTDVATSLEAFYQQILEGTSRPRYAWNVSGNTIEVSVDPENPPTAVRLWQASNRKTRDFRVVRIRKSWADSDMKPVSPGRYVAVVKEPEEGWIAFFVELTFGGEPGDPASDGPATGLKVTSGVHVVPTTLPFGSYEPDQSRLP